jgi:hypothetical protein
MRKKKHKQAEPRNRKNTEMNQDIRQLISIVTWLVQVTMIFLLKCLLRLTM